MAAARNRQKLVESLDELMGVTDDLIRTLRTTKSHYRRTRTSLEGGRSVQDALTVIPAGELRQSLTQAIADLEAARHHVRLMTFAVGLNEGMSIGELARVWGFSRQLASRYAKEARGELPLG